MWDEALARLNGITDLPDAVRSNVNGVLHRTLTVGTVEQIDSLVTPAVWELRDFLEQGRHADVTAKVVVVTTAGDLWKAYADGKTPCYESSGISIRKGANTPTVTCTDPTAEAKRTALDRAHAMVTAEGGDKADAMEKLIARVQLQMGVDKANVINMPLTAFVTAAMEHRASNGVIVDHQADNCLLTPLTQCTNIDKLDDIHRDTKRQTDLATIKNLFSNVPRRLVDKVLAEAAMDRIHINAIECLSEADEIFYSTLFHLYDTALRQLLEDFFVHWNMAWDVGLRTHHDHLNRGLATSNPSARRDEHEQYHEHVMQAQRAMAGLTRYLRETFPEFNLVNSDEEASRKYKQMERFAKERGEELFGNSKTSPSNAKCADNVEISTPAAQTTAPRPDVLLVTVNARETRAVHDAFQAATGERATTVSIDDRVYHNLGTLNGTKIFHALSEMGSSSVGAMQQTVDKAIRALDPGAVIAVGVAFGVNDKDQHIGDILLSKQLRPYDLQRVGSELILRGDKPHSAPRLINYFDGFAQTARQGAKVWAGVILTGDKLIDDLDYRDALLALEVEAVGGEMEGTGLYVACHEHKVDWIVIKAICDWADGKKSRNKTRRQEKAAANAVQFLVEALQRAPLKRSK